MNHSFASLVPSWRLAMEVENKSPKTIKSYTETVDLLDRWLDEHDHPGDPAALGVDVIRRWLVEVKETRSASTARTRWSGLRAFYAWAVEEGEVVDNPMLLIKAPELPQTVAPILEPGDVAALINVCQGSYLQDRRDEALLLMFADTGGRLSEIALARLEDLDLRERTLLVMGKGRKQRVLPFGARTARSVDRYLRMRNRSKHAEGPWLWISAKDGRGLTADAVYQMVRRRAAQAGLDGVHPHLFRHGFADAWLRSGGSEGDLMELAGWESRQMLERYAKATRAERAREAYRSRSPMDNLG